MCARPFETRSLPSSLAATIAALPSMSFFPKAPFDLSVCPSMSRATRRLRSLAATLRGFTFYLAVPISSIR